MFVYYLVIPFCWFSFSPTSVNQTHLGYSFSILVLCILCILCARPWQQQSRKVQVMEQIKLLSLEFQTSYATSNSPTCPVPTVSFLVYCRLSLLLLVLVSFCTSFLVSRMFHLRLICVLPVPHSIHFALFLFRS